MLYTIIYTNENGETRTAHINANNAKQAHEQAAQNANGATVRTYPTTQDEHGNIISYNVLRGALQAAKRSAEKATANGGTDTQFRIANELTGANAKAGADGAEQYGEAYILDLTARLSADSQDIFGYAYSGILTAINEGKDISEQYHAGYLSINAYIMKQRAATAYETSTEFIEESGGALVAINSYIARIINNGERYTPMDGGTMDAETAERLGAALSGASIALTPRQKDIAEYIGRGLSQKQVAEKMYIKNVATVNEHLTRIRKIYLEYFTENAPEFLYIIKGAEVKADKVDRHKKSNRHNAEYYRAYRARKKAEKNA